MAETKEATEQKTLVMVAIDSSKHSADAFDWYVDKIHKPGNDLLLVHIANPPYASEHGAGTKTLQQISASSVLKAEQDCSETLWESDYFMSGDVWNERWAHAKDKAKQLEQEYAAKMREKKVFGQIKAYFNILPGVALVKVAKENNVSMVVMGTRGLGTIKRTILGSVSHHVLHHVHCPCIIYNSEKHK